MVNFQLHALPRVGVEYAVCRPKDKPKALKRDSVYNIDMVF